MNAGRMTPCQLTVAPEGCSEAHACITHGSFDHAPSRRSSLCELACHQLTANLSQGLLPTYPAKSASCQGSELLTSLKHIGRILLLT